MKKIIKNFLSLGLSSVLSQLISFVCVTYYANMLGKDLFGVITLAQQIVLYFTTFTLFGIQTYATRYLVKNKDKINETVGKIMMFRFLVSLLSFVLIVMMTFVLNKGENFDIILILFGVTLFPIALNIDYLFNAFEAMKYNSIFVMFKNILPSIIIFISLSRGVDYRIIPIATFIGGAVGVIYQVIIAKLKFNVKFKFAITMNDIRNLCIVGSPFLFSSMMSMINNNCDKIILGMSNGGEGQLGIYQAAYIFMNFLISVIALLFTAIFPSMSRYYYDKDYDNLKKLCNITTKIVTAIAVPMMIGGILLSKDIINIFKPEYADAYRPFNVLIVFVAILFIREIYAYELNAWGLEKKYLKIVSVSSILNLIFNLILIPRYGYMAAAYVTLFTEFINFFAMRSTARNIVSVNDVSDMIKPIIPSLIMGIAIVIMKIYNINFILIIITAIAVYVALIIIFKIISIADIKTLME